MLYDPARHEALNPVAWEADAVRAAIEGIVADTERAFDVERWWPQHPRDADTDADLEQPLPPLYFGACGVFWALHYLQSVGAVRLLRDYHEHTAELLARNRAWLGDTADTERASYLMGETPILLWSYGRDPSEATAERLHALIEGNLDHPARELMWGAPGTLLAALWLQQRSGEPRWAELFRRSATRLWQQLQWSDEFQCRHWTQDMYGQQSTYVDAVHGFVATASVLIRGRDLLAPDDWTAWQRCIARTVQRTATWEGGLVNWLGWLSRTPTKPMLMQYCHGAPGFVVCLADFPGTELDALLIAAGEATWAAGPLSKGSNLCHGSGGNGYAFLALWQRTGNALWLARARAFAMHGIAQTAAERALHGRLRFSLWTGDLGFAIYLCDCLRGQAQFPTLDVFYGTSSGCTG